MDFDLQRVDCVSAQFISTGRSPSARQRVRRVFVLTKQSLTRHWPPDRFYFCCLPTTGSPFGCDSPWGTDCGARRAFLLYQPGSCRMQVHWNRIVQSAIYRHRESIRVLSKRRLTSMFSLSFHKRHRRCILRTSMSVRQRKWSGLWISPFGFPPWSFSVW